MSLDILVIKDQIKNLSSQRDNYAIMFQKCCGAIEILNEQLKISNVCTVESDSLDNTCDVNQGEDNGNS